MPIYLPPISRRQFLAGALAAGASLPLRSFGDGIDKPKERDPSRYLLISDAHVGSHFESVKHHVKPAVEFSRAIDQILAMKDRPRRVIAAGDYAISRGNHENCKMFHKLMMRLSEAGMSCHFALGNHDSRRPFLDEFRHAKELIDPHAKHLGKFVYVLETPHVNWFFLDSLHEGEINLGTLGQPQLDWLAGALDARRDKPALIIDHHNPEMRSAQRDTAAFYKVIMPRRQVKAYIYGHTHRWGLDKTDGVHLVNIPTVSAWKDANQPRGFLTADLHANGITVTLHTLGRREGKPFNLKWRSS